MTLHESGVPHAELEATHVTKNQVRNILANELGLSRETVVDLINQRIDNLLKQAPVETIIKRATENAIDRLVRGDSRGWNTVSLRSLVEAETARQLRDTVSVSVQMKR